MKHFLIVLFITFCTVSSSFASTRLPNRPYVQSMDGGIFYARCIPAEKKGSKGTTTIYRVEAEADEKLDVYDWYAPEGVILGWSPIVGKVAVMALQGRYDLQDNQVVFSFQSLCSNRAIELFITNLAPRCGVSCRSWPTASTTD